MRILFHAPGLAAFRPNAPIPHLLGVPATATDTLAGLRSTHQLTGNRGNIIHAEAPAKIFYKKSDASAFGNLNTLHKTLGDNFPLRMAARFDIIIISMANFIRPDHDGTNLFNALKALNGAVKFIVLGAGLQGTHKLRDMMPGNRDLLAIMNEQAAIFGVRGEETGTWLADNGFGNAAVLGCPSLYTYPQSIMAIDASAVRAKGAAADVMTAGHLGTHNGKMPTRGQALIKALKGIDASYVLQDEFLTYGPVAKTPFLYHEGSNTCQPAPINDWLSQHSKVPVDFRRYYYFTEAGSWRQGALRHDVYIGDRFHGGVAAMQAGLPTIFLKYDNRVSELTRFFDLPNLTIADFAKKGLAATLDEHLNDDALTRMKTRYKQRHAAFCEAMTAHDLVVETQIEHPPLEVSAETPIAAPSLQGASKLHISQQRLANYTIRTIRPPNAREIVVSFEAADATIPRHNQQRPGFGEPFLRNNGYAVVSILTDTPNWYRTPDIGEFFNTAPFKNMLAQFDRVHSYGSSMGGYGACAFADMLGCHNVVALQPISTLSSDLVPWENRFVHGKKLDWRGPYRDAAQGVTSPDSIYTLFDPAEMDAKHADRLLKTAPDRVRTIAVPKAKHAVPRYLQGLGILKDVSLMCLRGEPVDQITAKIAKHTKAGKRWSLL